ncbi:MAG: glycosyltransferase [Saprospiraceae bacterium]|nr:glycosyltransferase [Saprospiraceae bacterium]
MADAVNKRRNIVYLGETGFPYGLAPIQRQLLLSRGMVESGAKVLVISTKGVFKPGKDFDLAPSGTYQGIDYIYTSGEVIRRPAFLRRNMLKIKGLSQELFLLLQLRKKQKIDVAIVATMRFQSILYYYIVSRIFRFKVLLNYVECNSAISTRTKTKDRINDFLVDRFGICCADAIMPISEFLKNHVRQICKNKPQIKIPIVGDFQTSVNLSNAYSNYFLYCGSASYLELIDFIICSFELIKGPDVFLYLVVSGDKPDMDSFARRLKRSNAQDQIKIFSGIPYSELLEKYRNAKGLLIPLRNTIQDIARFPHKIGEYLASGVPIVTTKFGEISHYFTDGKNAIISEKYDVREYATKMQYVLDHPREAEEIGLRGKKMGKELFDYRRQGSALYDFIQKL